MSTTSKKARTSAENGKKGGRPKGKKTQAVLEREAVFKEFRNRVVRLADILLDNQLVLARGQTFLYKIEKYYEKVKDKKGKMTQVLRQRPPERVTNEYEIRQYLEGLVEQGDMNDPEDTYYFLTTKEPDNKAIDSMLNRTFGKAVQAIAFTDPDGGSLIDDETKQKSKKAVAQALAGDTGTRR